MPSFVRTRLPLTPTASLSCLRILRTGFLPARGELARGELLHERPRAVGAQGLVVVERHGHAADAREDEVDARALDVGAHERSGVHAAAGVVGGVADAGDERS